MTPEPESEHGFSDSPAGREPAGEPGADRASADTGQSAADQATAYQATAYQASTAAPMGASASDTASFEPMAAVPAWPAQPSPAPSPPQPAGPSVPAESPQRWTRRARLGFRGWRRTRPFWGGLFVLLGGGEIIFTYKAPMALVMHFGLYGLAGYLVPGLLVLLGLLLLFDPQHRTFYSVLAVLAALGTWLTSNLGGFILGMLFGLIGGSLAFGWQAGPKPVRRRRRRYRPTPTH